MKRKNIIKTLLLLFSLFIVWIIINSFRIYNYSLEYSEKPMDVGIVLGAGANNGKLSPVFRERVNHAINLYNKGIIKNIIFTGGYGENEIISDSKSAENYAINNAIPKESIFIEEKSIVTYTNLKHAKKIMNQEGFTSALIISDPIHMKRAMLLSKSNGITCASSPTKTSMYKSKNSKIKFLLYESFYYNVDLILGHFN